MNKHLFKLAVSKLTAAHPAVHAVYFGLVTIEAGKWYAVAAGALLVISLSEIWETLMDASE